MGVGAGAGGVGVGDGVGVGGGDGGVATAAACSTVQVWPAMVTDPLRACGAVLLSTDSVTAPLPLPAPCDTPIQPAPLDAVQAQPFCAETAIDRDPPEASNVAS